MFAPWTPTTVPELLLDFQAKKAPSDLGLAGEVGLLPSI